MSNVVAYDSEVFYSPKLKYSLSTQIAEQFCRSPLFDCYMISVATEDRAWSGHPSQFNWQSLEGKMLISHNKYWDQACYEELVRRGLAPRINFAGWECSANMSAFLWNRRSLADAVEHAFKVKLDKSARADAANKHWPQDFSPDEQTKMLQYSKDDAVWTYKLWRDFSHLWPLHERKLSNLTIEAGLRGVQIDVPLLNQYILQTHDMKTATEKLLPWLDDQWDEADEFNTKPTSSKCVAEQCRRVGIPCPPVMSKDQDGFDEWEATYSPNHAWIQALSSWRSVNKLLKTFQTMKERLRDDGTMPFGQRYCGTHTGRVSGESRVNLFNQRKQAVLCRQDGLMETDTKKIDDAHKERKKTSVWPAWVKCGIDFRNLIIARPGYRLIASDASQIEPRVAAWLAGDTPFLELVGKGFSPYQAHAMTTMNWAGGNLKEEDEKLYALAKARLLSLGYGAGYEKLIIMAKAVAGLDLTTNDAEFIEVPDLITGEIKKISGYGQNARQVVKDYRDSNPKIVEIWATLENSFRRSIGGDFELRLPSGRVMRYEAVRAETRIEPDKETKKPRRRTVFTACIGGKRVITYGSKLFENAVQATAREIFYHHVLKLHESGLTMLIGVYDEVVLEISIDSPATAGDVVKIMSETPAWIPGIPLAAEGKELKCYQK